MTIIALSTSIPDTILSVSKARQDEGVTSLANVFGSNTFNLLVVVPVGVLVAGSVEIDFALALPLFGFLSFGTVLLFTFIRTDFNLSMSESYALILAYGVFVLWMIFEALHILSFLPAV